MTSMCSTSRKTTVPLGNPSRAVVAIASRASIAPCAAFTYDAEQREPVVATGAVERRVMVRTRALLCDFFDLTGRDVELRAVDEEVAFPAPSFFPHVCWPT